MTVSMTIPGMTANIPKTPPLAITQAIPPAVNKILTNLPSYNAERLFYKENILSGNFHNSFLTLIPVQ